jgi:hypothetical protein
LAPLHGSEVQNCWGEHNWRIIQATILLVGQAFQGGADCLMFDIGNSDGL